MIPGKSFEAIVKSDIQRLYNLLCILPKHNAVVCALSTCTFPEQLPAGFVKLAPLTTATKPSYSNHWDGANNTRLILGAGVPVIAGGSPI